MLCDWKSAGAFRLRGSSGSGMVDAQNIFGRVAMGGIEIIQVGLGERSYRILVGCGILGKIVVELDEIQFPRRIALITNTAVADLYGELVRETLKSGGYDAELVVIPDGEEFKSFSVLEDVLGKLIARGFDRSSGILALGGGVVGDLAGFAAAIYLRGIPFVQVPTTLLAQVDSSVGGKTAVNHRLGKNLIGAFYQPQLVFIDVDLLRTLPDREFVAGMAEVIKYGVIRDRDFFSWLENNCSGLLQRQPRELIEAIKISCQIKANIVENDEKEGGLRAILNFGHTFGHAVEQLAGYGVIRHGEAVSIGMVVAAGLALRKGFCSKDDLRQIRNLLIAFGLPIHIPEFPQADYLTAMGRDKKVHEGRLRMVLNRGIGACLVETIEDPEALFAELG
jgi:3-dehydroquinate synthase